MPEFPPIQLSSWTGGRWTALPVAPLPGFAIDSRALRPGEMFVALKTEKRDGHDYLVAAQAAGAGAALVACADPAVALPQLVVADPLAAFQKIAREHRKMFPGPVVAVTGSAGKTSTKNLLALLLAATEGDVLATEGNLNNHLGVPLTLTRLDPVRHRAAVVEAGVGAPGEMAPLAAMIRPDLALVTTVAPAHLAAFRSIEAIAREKAALPAAGGPGGAAIFPHGCARFTAFQGLLVDQIVLEPALLLRPVTSPGHTVHYNVIQRPTETIVLLAYGPPPPLMFRLRRVTDGMAQNAALALAAALRLGVSREALAARLARWVPAPLRGEWRREEGKLFYLDCYNANPTSMADALTTFAAIAPSEEPRLYVLGGMEELGPDSAALHRQLGRALRLREGDRLFAIGGHADEVCAGVADQGGLAPHVRAVDSLEPIADALAAWQGAVFLKGSRRHRLETLLASAPEPALCAH